MPARQEAPLQQLHSAVVPGSCRRYGCIGYQPRNLCQCNEACVRFQSCCSDFDRCQPEWAALEAAKADASAAVVRTDAAEQASFQYLGCFAVDLSEAAESTEAHPQRQPDQCGARARAASKPYFGVGWAEAQEARCFTFDAPPTMRSVGDAACDAPSRGKAVAMYALAPSVAAANRWAAVAPQPAPASMDEADTATEPAEWTLPQQARSGDTGGLLEGLAARIDAAAEAKATTRTRTSTRTWTHTTTTLTTTRKTTTILMHISAITARNRSTAPATTRTLTPTTSSTRSSTTNTSTTTTTSSTTTTTTTRSSTSTTSTTSTEGKVAQLSLAHGHCLRPLLPEPGAPLALSHCLAPPQAQAWVYDEITGLLTNPFRLCLDHGGVNLTVHLWTCMADNPAQHWTLSNGRLMARDEPGRCLEVVDRSTGEVEMRDCNRSDAGQHWTAEALPGMSGVPVFVRGPYGRCLGATVADNVSAPVELQDCGRPELAPSWVFDTASRLLRLSWTDACLAIAPSPADGDDGLSSEPSIVMAPCQQSDKNQHWGYFRTGQIQSLAQQAGLCVEGYVVDELGEGQHTSFLRLAPCHASNVAQQWSFGDFAGSAGVAPPPPGDCLCVFDVDRTLTGKQGVVNSVCQGNLVVPNVTDPAFAGGALTLSAAAQGIGDTFCSRCYLGAVSAGAVGGPEEQASLWERLRGKGDLPSEWCEATSITSPLVTLCPDQQKADCVNRIVAWYTTQGVTIVPRHVHFFDDREGNTGGFTEYGFNARQVSCSSRDTSVEGGLVGLCGATVEEIVQDQGVFSCRSKVHDVKRLPASLTPAARPRSAPAHEAADGLWR